MVLPMSHSREKSGEASPTISSCYANIPVLIGHENSQFLIEWIMVNDLKFAYSITKFLAGFASARRCNQGTLRILNAETMLLLPISNIEYDHIY